MATVAITKRTRRTGTRYVVRYRLGGKFYPLIHAGSFKTLTEAKTRRGVVAGEIAAGRDPSEVLAQLLHPQVTRTFKQLSESYLTSRIDIGAETRKNAISHIKAMAVFYDRDPATIRPSDVQEWIGSLELKPSSIRRYVGTLGAIFDFAEINPNPAKDQRVKLPREEKTIVEPPSSADVDAILAYSPERWRLPLRTLEQTGMRVGELASLEWRDIDIHGSRFRIRKGKTAAARRWVAVPAWLMEEINETCPPDDRTAERPVFVGFSADVARNVMARACKAAGIAHYHPHDLRHRYASVKVSEGVPITNLAAQLGHSKKSLTLDVYSHVLMGETP